MAARKVPNRQARRTGAPQPPIQAERDFAKGLVGMAGVLAKRLRAIFLPLAQKHGRKHADERADAKDDGGLKTAARSARSQAEAASRASFTSKQLKAETDRASRRVEAQSKEQFRRLGVKPEKEPVLDILVKGWARDITVRVADLGNEAARKLEAILLSGQSRYTDTLARDIEEQLGVTTRRAEFIARDSIGTLNSKITRERFRAADIELYVWTTMGDARVREEHEDLDGEVFDVDGDGDAEEGHPGEPPACRCIQFPLVRDASDEPGDEPSDDEDEDEE